MAHIPVNHHLRPLYRVLAAICGIYVLLFGVVGFVQTSGSPAFDQGDAVALGLQTNLAFSLLSIVVGAIVVLCVVLGRNLDFYSDLVFGAVFLLVGMAELALMRTDANVLNFSMATCIVSFIVGLVLFTAGLYGRVGTAAAAAAEEALRHGGH
jgi:Domain of unknown function (DUF4383)